MTVSVSSTTDLGDSHEVSIPPGLTVAEIDRSCRMPVLILFTAAAAWLGIGAVLGVITAIKAHAPGFLADWAWLTYGRVRPAGVNALIYGFVLQAGLGLALWMFCRLGRNTLEGARMISLAALLWNVGLLVGWCGILAGASSGYVWLEMPGAASPILFSSWVLAGVWALINLHWRNERTMYVSQWFLLAGLLWFPWIYSTAEMLLVYHPARGVMQAVVNGWYMHNLYELCLAPFGLAAVFYFIPKLCGRPLHSRGLALFAFWLWVLFGGWGGARFGEPVPSWISSVSMVGRVFLLVAVAAFVISWYRTAAPIRAAARSDVVLRFILFAASGYAFAAVLDTAGSHPMVSRLTLFTLYGEGIQQLKIHGFLAMALTGAFYYVAPRLTGCDWPSARLIRLHFWLAAAGTALTVVSLIAGGLIQGAGINRPETEFMKVVRSTLPFLGMSTLGATLLCAGYAVFVLNLGRLLMASCSVPWSLAWLRPTETPQSTAGVHPGGRGRP